MEIYSELGLIRYKGGIYYASRQDVSNTPIYEWTIWLLNVLDDSQDATVITESEYWEHKEEPTELEYLLYS